MDYTTCLLNLGAMPYNELSSEPALWAGFAALRGAFRPEEGEANLAAILRKLPDGSVLEKQVAAYIIGKWNIRPRELRAALIEAKPERGEANMGLLAEGLKAEGVAEGVAGMLKRQLQRRFGPLSESVQSRIEQAPIEDLEAWSERFVGASSLEAVFGGAQR